MTKLALVLEERHKVCSSSVFFFGELNPRVIVMEDSFFSVPKHIVCCYEEKILIGQFPVNFQQQVWHLLEQEQLVCCLSGTRFVPLDSPQQPKIDHYLLIYFLQ